MPSRPPSRFPAATSAIAAALLALAIPPLTADENFVELFNGSNLEGWDGNPELWKIEDGIIVGSHDGPEALAHNEFLIWRGGAPANFELRAEIRIIGENNSGIQYRSRELPEAGSWVVGGYQCDIHPNPPFNAMFYDERGRGIVARNGQDVISDPQGGKWLVTDRDPVTVDPSEWQEYAVIAKGNHIEHRLNGETASTLIDHDESARSLEGLIAIQLHRGNAMRVEIRSVKLKTLSEGGVTPFEQANVPSDAQRIEAPAPGKGKAKAGAKAPAKAPAKGAPQAQAPAAKGPQKAKRPGRPAEVGPRVGENQATPVDRIKAPEGFEVELIYSVPGGDQGSWIALCHDDQGRIYASDQYGHLYRFVPPAPGETLEPSDIEKVPVEIRAINGMVFAFGALYAGVNDYERQFQSGLYRITDSDGNDELDTVELLRAFDSGSDHGVHAVVPTPDGEGLFLITGNNAIIEHGPLEGTPDSSPVPKIWGEDHLLPRMPDGRGHNRHVLAPAGIIYRVDPEGKEFEIYATGFRNIYDASVNLDGELFTYDADMEYDFNTPWYRPTRVNHVVSGGEYGWRNGAGKYPDFYPDNLPTTVDIGPGSPTGTTFGYGARFPARYQSAYYAFDWSWGKVYAVHLEEDGSTYTGTREEFLSGSPLPVTDAIVLPQDGAIYFAIGGRRVQSGLYRVSYRGDEDTSPIDLAPRPSEARDLRHRLEAWHGRQDPAALDAAWPHLDHEDRFIRWAARTVLEHQPAETWADRAAAEPLPGRRLAALLALARATGTCPQHRPEEGHDVDEERRAQLLGSLLELDFGALSFDEQILYARTAQIVLNRFGMPGAETVEALIAALDPAFPAEAFELNWLLCETLAFLQAPNTAAKAMDLIAAAGSQEPQMEFARSIRFLQTGWTPELRQRQLEWFLTAANYRGGASFEAFIQFIRDDSLATFTEAELATHAELIAKEPERISALENVGAIFVGRTPTAWTVDELAAAAEAGLESGRDFENGRRMFSATACYACHRFGNAGGMNGPDLTGAGGRYNVRDLLTLIIDPSSQINEQFAPIVVTMNDGRTHTGLIVNLSGDNITLNTDLTDPNQRVNVDRKEVASIETSPVSPMPPGLLNMLTEEEVLDLLAYLLSGGDAEDGMFR